MKWQEDMYKVFNQIDINYLDKKYHNLYFMIKFSLRHYIKKNLTKEEKTDFVKKHNIIQRNLQMRFGTVNNKDNLNRMQVQESYFRRVLNKIQNHRYLSKTNDLVLRLIQIFYNFYLLLPILLGLNYLIVFVFYSMPEIFIALCFIMIIPEFIISKKYIRVKKKEFLKKNLFKKKIKIQKIRLILLECLMNFILSFSLIFNPKLIKGTFQRFLFKFDNTQRNRKKYKIGIYSERDIKMFCDIYYETITDHLIENHLYNDGIN